ncbi:hypothetical protein QTO01_11210 [Vibrio mytili]|uniref:hypothetical protein n=1 Tax=Vibrio mytili TaxID=50718 RepID=UPI002F3EAF43
MIQPFSTQLQAYLANPSVKLAYFVEIDLPQPALVHTGIGDITFNNKTYTGVGNLGSISAVKQTGELESNSIDLTLSGLDDGLLDVALTDSFVMKDVRIFLGVIDPDDNQNVLAMDLIHSGFVADVSVGAGSSNGITLAVSTKLDKWDNGLPDRFSDESHLQRNPNDHFFRYLAATSTMDVRWGNTATKTRARY